MTLRSASVAVVALMLVAAGTTLVVPDLLETGQGDAQAPHATNLSAASDSGDGEHTAEDVTVQSEDGTEIVVTIFQPADASSQAPVPMILHGHGWAGARTTDVDGFAYLLDAGYGVTSIDMRGHGDSGGQANVMNPDAEIQDVKAVIDHIATLDWVAEDGPSDPLLGAIGGSYGGGYQLLTAAFDDRLDAMVPEITWHDLPQALAPGGAVKSLWVDLLYVGGTTQAELAPFIHQGYAWANTFNEFPNGELPGEPDVESKFVQSSPKSYPQAISIPTLLIQGMPDALFNLNQAIGNAEQIADTGAEVKLVTHLNGHILHTDGTIPEAPVEGGFQDRSGPDPCGEPEDLQLRWFDEHLKQGADDGLAPVSMALDDGTCVTGQTVAELVLQDPDQGQSFDLAGPVIVPQVAPMPTGHLEVEGEEVDLESPQRVAATTVEQDRLLTGVPKLTGQATVAGAEAIVYLSIVVQDGDGDSRVVNHQVTPLKLQGPSELQTFEVELTGIGTQLTPGDTVLLQVSSQDLQFAHNAERLPGGLVLEDLTLHLPLEN